MQLYTHQQCDEWLSGRQRERPDAVTRARCERVAYPSVPHGIYGFARWFATTLTYRQPALLWITEWDIWPSSENWHLYYKLRHSYGDQRLLQDAPGHLFLGYEAEDLGTFLQVAMLNGWGGYVLTEANYANAFFSHDAYIDFFAEQEDILLQFRQALGHDLADEN